VFSNAKLIQSGLLGETDKAMKKIILRLDKQAPAHCAWVKIEADGSSMPGRGGLAELAAGAEGYRLLVLIPGAEVLLTRVTLPPGKRRQLLAAIPFALEESLAAEVEDQHCAIGVADDKGALAVAVIARVRLGHWLGLCQAQGLKPVWMSPDVLALPIAGAGRAILLEADGPALIRLGAQEGFVLEHDNLAMLAGLPGVSSEAPFLLLHEGEANLPGELLPLLGERRLVTEVTALLAEGLIEKEALNLLQGAYLPQTQWERLWPSWRWPAFLLLALLLVQTGSSVLENNRLRRYEEQLRAEITQVYRQSFPEAQRIVNPRAQMEHQLQILRGNGAKTAAPRNFLRLLEQSGPILTAGGSLPLRGLRYRLGELALDLETSDLQTLNDLKDQLSKQGLTVELGPAITQAGQVQASLQLKEGR